MLTSTDDILSPTPKKFLIVGGGVFGLNAAIALRQRQHTVIVFDRLPIPAEDGSSNDINRIVRMDYGAKGLEQGLAEKAILKWREWNDDATKVLPDDDRPLFDECGIILACQDKVLGPYERGCVEFLSSIGHGPLLQELSASELGDKFPAFAEATSNSVMQSAYYNKLGGMVNANKAMVYLKAKADAMGVEFFTGEDHGSVADFISNADGRVAGLTTRDGVHHYADAVLVAAGAWSASIVPELASLVVASGQPVIYVSVPENLREEFSSKNFPVWTADITKTGIYGFPVQEGVLKFACHSLGFTNPTPAPWSSDPSTLISIPSPVGTPLGDTIPAPKYKEMLSFLRTLFPSLADAPVARARLCWYTNTFDERFVISAVPHREGLYVATGGSGHGFKFAPVIGDVIADVVSGIESEVAKGFAWRDSPAGTGLYLPKGDGTLREHLPI
ncbi:FAD dependent oxidoreductase [Fimicolochytrium jonesii]|uniref:FAD dependent oxidoreductase n=1 Tax=Fimicolochytrium jonesii TaxID=1396493 RepID=UPI0022FE163B|nr:FAD dependent oxidoreductase [Fimicolochytrium jonesii]KAI8823720.1 FAD dependent oxidoreductase [Fimicolochytrium jonesii]